MSTAIMPTSTIYDLGDLDLLLKHPAPGLSNGISNPGSPGSGSSNMSTNSAGSIMMVRPPPSSALRWNGGAVDDDRHHEPLSRRASHPVANSVASLVTSLILDNLNHRRLDRSHSDPTKAAAAALSVNTSRYKTELCRPFEENGSCKYGDKCQFAHGFHELRNLVRHPKYKTELCRTFHTVGFCPYGPRCHFIHNAEEELRARTAGAGGVAIKSSKPKLSLPPAPAYGSSVQSFGSADSPTPPSSLGSGSPPPTANNAFSFAPLVPTPTSSLSPSQSPPPPPASPETRLPVFNKLSGQMVQFTFRIGELIA